MSLSARSRPERWISSRMRLPVMVRQATRLRQSSGAQKRAISGDFKFARGHSIIRRGLASRRSASQLSPICRLTSKLNPNETSASRQSCAGSTGEYEDVNGGLPLTWRCRNRLGYYARQLRRKKGKHIIRGRTLGFPTGWHAWTSLICMSVRRRATLRIHPDHETAPIFRRDTGTEPVVPEAPYALKRLKPTPFLRWISRTAYASAKPRYSGHGRRSGHRTAVR